MIYITCPAGVRTGGVELLHQLAHELSKYLDTRLYYIGFGLIDEYSKYQIDYVYELPDNDDYVVVPEIWAHMDIGQHKRIVYWESVDNFFARYTSLIFDDDVIHLAQSAYSLEIIKYFIQAKHYIELTDYINDDFLAKYEEKERRPIVLYNPAKGMEHTQKIINASDFEFRPITGMTRAQTIDLMHEAMVYIDFGDHPGKDRMPREAAACGCCVLTGRNGSAFYHKDIPISDMYKIERDNIGDIVAMIRHMLDNYDKCINDFNGYRKAIRAEKRKFQKGVRELVHEIQRNNTSV